MATVSRIPGCRGEFLWEIEIAERQVLGLAEAFPPEKYDWRPDPKARSVSEVLVHIAAGSFMLLDMIGIPVPADLYQSIPENGQERFLALIKTSDQLEAGVREKPAVINLVRRAFQALRQALTRADDAELECKQHFFYEDTTVRRIYLRLIAHTHEHMGQLIAYLRFNGIAPPWQDWRPDRRM